MEFIKIKDVSELLGVSEQSIYKWMKNKQDPIPHYNKTGSLRFDKDEIVKWFKDKK